MKPFLIIAGTFITATVLLFVPAMVIAVKVEQATPDRVELRPLCSPDFNSDGICDSWDAPVIPGVKPMTAEQLKRIEPTTLYDELAAWHDAQRQSTNDINRQLSAYGNIAANQRAQRGTSNMLDRLGPMELPDASK